MIIKCTKGGCEIVKELPFKQGDFLTDKIRELRKHKGFTLRKFAELMNITPTYLSQIERGGIIPSAEVISKMAVFLGIAPLELYKDFILRLEK